MDKTNELHKLLNRERTKRGLTYARWNQGLWRDCKSHSNELLRARRLFHAPVSELPSGGECICGGKGNHSPKALCKSWMNSPGHKALILSSNVRSHAVAISSNRQGTYATWRGSNNTITTPLKWKIPNPFNLFKGRSFMPTNPFKVGLSLILGFSGLLGILLGAHGIYVYFNRLEVLFGGEGGKLFLLIDVPIRLRDVVMWASVRGLQSWFTPLLVLLGGWWLFSFSHISAIISRLLSKIQP